MQTQPWVEQRKNFGSPPLKRSDGVDHVFGVCAELSAALCGWRPDDDQLEWSEIEFTRVEVERVIASFPTTGSEQDQTKAKASRHKAMDRWERDQIRFEADH